MAKKKKQAQVLGNEELHNDGPNWTEEDIEVVLFPDGVPGGIYEDDWPDYND